MKRAVLLCAVLVAVPSAFAQSGMKDMDMKGMKSEQKAGALHKGTGVVTKVEKDKVTIKHEPIASINWPAMTMAFEVKDKALLDKVAKDKKVQFEFVQEGKKNVITSIK